MEAVAKLNNYPTSPRKMRLLADLIRGMEVEKALGVLQYNPKHPATPLYKLLKSAINNWEQKNATLKVEDAGLIVKTIMVDGGRVIKRMRPAPQGRGYRVRKRSNHVTIVVDSAAEKVEKAPAKSRKRKAAAPVAEAVKVAEEVVEEVKAEVATAKEETSKAAKKAEVKVAAKSEAKVAAKAEEKKVEKKAEAAKAAEKKAEKKEAGEDKQTDKK